MGKTVVADLSHHDPTSKNYSNHVIPLFGNDHCIGCLASSIFLIFFAPILAYLFFLKFRNLGIPVLWLKVLFFVLWLFLTVSEVLRSWKGTTFQINFVFRTAYLTFLLLLIVILPSPIFITGYSQLILIIGLTSPQILIYGYKIKTKSDFGNKYIKLVSRLMFIFAIFFMLLNIRSNIISKGILLMSVALIFIRIRVFASFMVDPEHTVQFRMFEKTFGTYLSKQGLIIEDTGLRSNQYFLSRQSSSIFAYFLFTLILIFGIISLHPIQAIYCKTHQSNSLTKLLLSNLIICKSITSQPFVKCINCQKMYPLSRHVPEFCSECGTELIPEEDIVYIESDNNDANHEVTEFGVIDGIFVLMFLFLMFLVVTQNRFFDSEIGSNPSTQDQFALMFGLSTTLAFIYLVVIFPRRRHKDRKCALCSVLC